MRIPPAAPVRKTKRVRDPSRVVRPRARPVSHLTRVRAAQAKRPATARRPAPMQAWPASVSTGAYGRVVRIGAYGTGVQAKLGWWTIISTYPAHAAP